MGRTLRPSLEGLEARALLSGVPSATSGLVSSVTAVASRTVSGSQVVATFTETNVTNHDVEVTVGPSDEAFTASQGGKVVWSEDAGMAIPDFLQVDQLKPHQSITLTETWDGRASDVDPAEPWTEGPPLSGTFTIANALDQGRSTATVTIPKSWTVPVAMKHLVPPTPSPSVHIMAIGVSHP